MPGPVSGAGHSPVRARPGRSCHAAPRPSGRSRRTRAIRTVYNNVEIVDEGTADEETG